MKKVEENEKRDEEILKEREQEEKEKREKEEEEKREQERLEMEKQLYGNSLSNSRKQKLSESLKRRKQEDEERKKAKEEKEKAASSGSVDIVRKNPRKAKKEPWLIRLHTEYPGLDDSDTPGYFSLDWSCRFLTY